MRSDPRAPDAGFTLVEVLTALVLFALIGTAGFTMLDQVLRTQRLTEGRLERLGEMQRAMYLMTLDFTQAIGASLRHDGATVTFRRSASDPGVPLSLRYALEGDVLTRSVSQGGDPAHQPLLTAVSAAGWRFHDPGAGWRPDWPPPGTLQVEGQPLPNPRAVELTLTLADGTQMRRVALLPGEVR